MRSFKKAKLSKVQQKLLVWKHTTFDLLSDPLY